MENEASASNLAWSWVIEALTRTSDLNASILYDLIRMRLQLSASLRKKTRELVALRCLKELFALSCGSTDENITPHHSKVGLDSSKFFEEGVNCLFQEVWLPNPRKPLPERLKHDVHSFIEHKEACSPKSCLDQLKDAILKGVDPLAASLKKASGLMEVKDNCDLSMHLEDGNKRAPRSRGDEFGCVDEVPPMKESVGKFLLETSPRSTLSASKRDRTCLTDVVSAMPLDSPCSRGSAENGFPHTKKLKQAMPCNLPHAGDHWDPLDSTVQSNGASESVLPVEDHIHVKANWIPLACLKEKMMLLDSNEQLVSKGEDSRVELLCQELHAPCQVSDASVYMGAKNECAIHPVAHVRKVLDDAGPDEDQDRTVAAENQEDNEHLDSRSENIALHGKESVTAKDMSIHCEVEKIIRDEDTDAAARKHDANYLAGKNLCMRCNKGGEVLICCAKGCEAAIHEKCLCFSATFDSRGEFYCPFCVYSRAISVYDEAKKRASLARKELTLFIDGNSSSRPQNHPSGLHPNNLSHGTSTGNVEKIDEGDCDDKMDIQQHKLSAPFPNGLEPVGEGNMETTRVPSHSLEQNKNKKDKVKQLPSGSIGQQEIGSEVDHRHNTVIESHGNETHALVHQAGVRGRKVDVLCLPVPDPANCQNNDVQHNDVETDLGTPESSQASDGPSPARLADAGVGIKQKVSREPIPDQSACAPSGSISDPYGYADGYSVSASYSNTLCYAGHEEIIYHVKHFHS